MADDATDDLYALPLEDFVPARDALAKELRREKRRDEATAVAALQKPTRPAWMVNQLSRTEGALTAKLLECAEALAEAQDAAVSGEGARDLRAATRAERQAVERLMEAARGLRPEGRSPSTAMLERVRVTLQAAAGDEALRERIRVGRLVEEPAAGGAWPLPGWGGLGAADVEETPSESGGRRGSAGRTAKRSTTRAAGPKADEDGRASPRRPAPRRRGGEQPTSRRETERREDGDASERERAATEARRRQEEREDSERERAEAAKRRAEVESALRTAKKAARDAARERERARRDAERASERLERLEAEVAAAQEAADGATARRELTEAEANEADAEVARLEAELRRR